MSEIHRLTPTDSCSARQRIVFHEDIDVSPMRTLILICWLTVSGLAGAFGSEYVLDFSSEATLKTLFDAGLRPTRMSASTVEDKCEVRNYSVVFIGKNGLRVKIAAEQVEFEIAADDTLQHILANSRNMNITTALREITPLFEPFGGPPDDLEHLLEEYRRTRLYEVIRGVGRVTPPDVEPSIAVGFMPGDFVLAEAQENHLRIAVSLRWKSNYGRKKLRLEPIKPPQGYEEFDMSPLPGPSEWKRAPDLFKSTPAPATTPFPTALPTPRARQDTPAESPLPSVANRRTPVWLWLGGAIALMSVGMFFWKRHRQTRRQR
jgi:hypothetical protein